MWTNLYLWWKRARNSHGHRYGGEDAADVKNVFEVRLFGVAGGGVDCEPPAREKLESEWEHYRGFIDKLRLLSQNESLVQSSLSSSKVGRDLEKTANFRQKIVISPLLLHLRRWSRKKPLTSSNQNNLHRLLSMPTGLQHFNNWSCFLNKNLSTEY